MQSKMIHQKKITTKQFPVMSKEDYYTNNDIPLWINHENIEFKSSDEMMSWVIDDKVNFSLSDKVYDAMIDCLETDIDATIVATIVVNQETRIDVLIRKPNFQKIFSSYTEKLLQAERYEKLAEIKSQIQKYDLEIPR